MRGYVAGPSASSNDTIDSVVREHILRILAESEGNISLTARRLGITRRTLQRKLKLFRK